MARYTEYRIAKFASLGYKPSKAFRALKDYQSFGEVAEDINSGILSELTTIKLDDSRRDTFYALGAGEGLLLDRARIRWQQRYFLEKFYLDKFFVPPPGNRRRL